MEPLQIDINHETRYDYSRPVYLDPHVLRLQPRTDGAQQLTAFDVEIDPPPAGLSRGFDAEGNVMLQTWFCGLHSSLFHIAEVESTCWL